jgi:hypothetical protein
MDLQPKKSLNKTTKDKERMRKILVAKKEGQVKNSSPVCYLDEEEIRPEYKDQ